MALSAAEKQKAYRERQREKLQNLVTLPSEPVIPEEILKLDEKLQRYIAVLIYAREFQEIFTRDECLMLASELIKNASG